MLRAVALFSGGLDSILAVRILQEQGLRIDALNVRTIFNCCKLPVAQTAADLGVRLTVLDVADDYLEVIRRPLHGYGKGINPCVDCRIYMARMAKRLMEQVGACVVITGEIIGQRPMSQKRQDLNVIERCCGLGGRLLRPLSAKLLEPTSAEREGLIDREKLYDFSGRSRGGLIELARRFGIDKIPTPSTGCRLTETTFAPRVRDLIEFHADATRWDFEILNVGRHFRIDDRTKVVVGRNSEENAALRSLAARDHVSESAILEPEDFVGPDALLVGRIVDESLQLAGALMVRYTRRVDAQNVDPRNVDPRNQEPLVRVTHGNDRRVIRLQWVYSV